MATPLTLAPDPEHEPTARERIAAIVERRLDIPMAVLSVFWAGLVAYDLVAPAQQRDELTLVGNIIWGIFVVEFVLKLVISGHPLRFLRRKWPSLLFLILPILRILRIVRAVRILRVLPAARVVGSSYRAIGTARSLLGGRLAYVSVISAVVVFSGGQLFHLIEGRAGDAGSLADAMWWSANAAISGSLVAIPETFLGRLLAIALEIYAVVVFAAVAATLGAFFIESRAERATVEDETDERVSEGPAPVTGT